MHLICDIALFLANWFVWINLSFVFIVYFDIFFVVVYFALNLFAIYILQYTLFNILVNI